MADRAEAIIEELTTSIVSGQMRTQLLEDAISVISELKAARPLIERAARKEALEDAARVAERDVDWCRFGQRDLEPWESGRDSVRDYRLGIVAGRSIAQAIRALDEGGGK